MPLTAFHPAVRRWFEDTLGAPSAPQRDGWPAIRSGAHTLIAAPTGSGKTLAAFLWAIDALLREGAALTNETRVLYVSPLKALGNDIRKNLDAPLAELRARDAAFPEIRVLVRSGDTPARERTAMVGRPPHILVTTPESLYILLTSDGGRRMLSTVRTVIVDEIHAVAGDKRGSHLGLSLERLESLAGPVQRIGLSATQKPIEDIARFLVGPERECRVVDAGHLREMDVAIELPASPLTAVCSHETWGEIYERVAELVRSHRTTLVFVNTRRLAERIAGQLTRILGEDDVSCHHGSLSKERRLSAEQRLKEGKLRVLVATASLELGIDIGDVDLVIQVGATRAIATFLQRVGRAGHGIGRIPKGRIFPLTRDELVEALALLEAVRARELDRIPQPAKPLDILAQQIIASVVPETRDEEELFESFRRAWPYRDLTRAEFDSVVALHTDGRRALLHRDGVNGKLLATRRARIIAMTSGGAIPDVADYRVLLEPEETFLGTLNEDFAVESSAGDVFQLGNASWRILKIERGTIRVADAKGIPPTIPFWLGEAPGRTTELAAAVSRLRERAGTVDDPEEAVRGMEVPPAAAAQLVEYFREGKRVLGAVPTQRRVILERFFDESGGMQLVVHAPFGSRITRAWGLALRKRFCRHFGFELQAAVNEEAIVLSLGPQHSFPLEEVFGYLHPASAREVLVQALLATPTFQSRWRWNISRALLLPRWEKGRRLPAPLARMRADDLLVQAFPEVLACPENLPPGDFPVPMEHPLVRQTIEDCLTQAMDVDGFLNVLRGIKDGSIETRAVDTPEPSVFAHGILNANPYGFLDDAPLEERRTQAVLTRRALDPKTADELGALDPAAVARVREEAWPQPRDVEEVHEALLWMGYVTEAEAAPWQPWIAELAAGRRVALEHGRWFATEASRDPKDVLRGRLEALGPVFEEDLTGAGARGAGGGNGTPTNGDAAAATNGDAGAPSPAELLAKLELEGRVLRCRLEGRQAWCDRRLLARIHRYTLDALRKEIEPVSAAEFLRFLARWQHADEESRLDGPKGVSEALAKLAGFEAPAAAWERSILPLRVRGYRRDWLDELVLSGEIAWGRLWGQGAAPVRTTPICFLRREDLDAWLGLAGPPSVEGLSAYGRAVHDVLRSRGALFQRDLERASRLLPEHFEAGLGELVGQGLLTNDSFRGLRQLLAPASRRRLRVVGEGRWSLFRSEELPAPDTEFTARRLLDRWGVVFRALLARERIPVPWRDLVRVYRSLELKGDVRGGRFVGGFSGEQYAWPPAVEMLRRVRRATSAGDRVPVTVAAADPLNLRGILTPDARVSPLARVEVEVG
ncbi:MAG: DEAD/DEAH box helicase [bacterium]